MIQNSQADLSLSVDKTASKKGTIKDSASGSQRVPPKSNSNSAKKGSKKSTKKGIMETHLDEFVGDVQSEKVKVKPALVSNETIISNSSFKV